jgi:hypothetical protein
MTLIYVKDEKMTIKSLIGMVVKAPKLDIFKLEDVCLDGTANDIIDISKALRGHPCLEEFHMTSITLADSTLTLDQVVSMMLVTVPNLTLIKLQKNACYCVHLGDGSLLQQHQDTARAQ